MQVKCIKIEMQVKCKIPHFVSVCLPKTVASGLSLPVPIDVVLEPPRLLGSTVAAAGLSWPDAFEMISE